MAFIIEFTSSAHREVKALERAVPRRLASHIDELAENPFPASSKKLKGQPDHYRLRIGDYRIIYRIEKKRVTIVVVKIGHRREVYR